MQFVDIPTVGQVTGVMRPPGSKSITNRAAICAALADGETMLSGVLESEDTHVMLDAWQRLGVSVDWNKSNCTAKIQGCGGKLGAASATLQIANSGTTIRFLTSALAACHGEFVLDGVARMRQRPIGDLIDGLTQLGSTIESLNHESPDCPPVQLKANGLRGGVARVRGNVSSQFLSGMLMASPYADSDVILQIDGELVSKPYVDMTLAIMEKFGAAVQSLPPTLNTNLSWQISSTDRYQGIHLDIEPDASAASYFWAAAAITGGKVTVSGLTKDALQGDVRFVKVLRQMGCVVEYQSDAICVEGKSLKGVDVDMSDISDTVQTLAVVALFAAGPTRVRGVAHNRHKETDRIGDLARELRKLGAVVLEFDDGLEIQPGELQAATLATYKDHRMAMSLALAGLRIPGVTIEDPSCTEKTYPNYWRDLGRLVGVAIATR